MSVHEQIDFSAKLCCMRAEVPEQFTRFCIRLIGKGPNKLRIYSIEDDIPCLLGETEQFEGNSAFILQSPGGGVTFELDNPDGWTGTLKWLP
jgi:hypothetical protein